jgi:hypothetical protein
MREGNTGRLIGALKNSHLRLEEIGREVVHGDDGPETLA